MTALALVAATLVTFFSPATASAATGTFDAPLDATLSEATPTTNDGAGGTLEIFGPSDEVTPDAVRSVIEWDLSSIPQGSTITDASVAFTVSDAGDDAVGYRLLRAWDEGEVTWNSADADTAWATAGADNTTSDRSTASIGTLELGTLGATSMELDTATVKAWVDDPTSNHGFVLVSAENNDGAFVRSGEAVTPAERPTLTVTYTAPAPIVVTTASPLTGGIEDAAYSAALTATGGSGTLTWSVTAGALPTGITLASDGTLSGTPTVNGTFNFTATATDIYDETGAKAFSLDIAAAPAGGSFIGITPNRVLDTREAGQTPCVSGPAGRDVVVGGTTGVPADAAAVAMNVTVVKATAPGFLQVYPAGETRPTQGANVNFAAGEVVQNLVTGKLGADGEITLFASGGCPNVVIDVTGYFTAGATGPGGFVGITSHRALDTRIAGTCVSGPGGRELVVAPNADAGVPADASAVALNVAVVKPTSQGFATVYPAGVSRPAAGSNLNYLAGQTVSSHVTAKVGTDGEIVVFASGGCPDVVVDILGYYTEGPAGPGGFVGITPNRVFDSREAPHAPCVAGVRSVDVADTLGVPADAGSVALSVAVVQPTAPGFLQVFPTGTTRPAEGASINYVAGQIVPNAVAAKVGTDGQISLFSSGGCPNVVIDVMGYYTAP